MLCQGKHRIPADSSFLSSPTQSPRRCSVHAATPSLSPDCLSVVMRPKKRLISVPKRNPGLAELAETGRSLLAMSPVPQGAPAEEGVSQPPSPAFLLPSQPGLSSQISPLSQDNTDPWLGWMSPVWGRSSRQAPHLELCSTGTPEQPQHGLASARACSIL